jgi:hypothetical protein
MNRKRVRERIQKYKNNVLKIYKKKLNINYLEKKKNKIKEIILV